MLSSHPSPFPSLRPISNPSVNIRLGPLVKHLDGAYTYGERHIHIDGYNTHTHTQTHRWIL